MRLPKTRLAVAMVCFGLGWTVFSWPVLSLFMAGGLPEAFAWLTALWVLALAGLVQVSGAVPEDDAGDASLLPGTGCEMPGAGKSAPAGGD